MVCILNTGEVTKDNFLEEMYLEYLKELDETIDTVCGYIPYEFGCYVYICIKDAEYKSMSKETIDYLLKILNNMLVEQ